MKLEMLKKIKLTPYIFLFFISFFLVLINTAMSPLYESSYITHDASVFYVIGRSMKNGLIPYKDLFDHKGLYIYFIYYLATIIGEANSIGLYIICSILTFILSIYVYKIVNLYKNPIISFFVSFIIIMLSTSMFFSHNAILCEFLALITITISIYIMCRYFKCNKFKPINMFVIGIMFSINLFNKANYCLFFLSIAFYFLIFLIFINKNYKLLIKLIIFGILGVIVGALPVIIYCLYNNCFKEMIEYVFIFNFKYVEALSIDLPEEIDTVPKAFFYTLKTYFETYILCIFSIIILVYKKFKINEILFYIFAFLLMVYATMMALTAYSHYMALMIPFLIPLAIVFVEGIFNLFINSKNKIYKNLKIVILTCFILLISNILGRQVLIINFSYSSSQAKKVKATLSNFIDLDENTNLICFGLGSYYYNFLGVIPKVKYFYVPGIHYNKFPEPINEAYNCVIENKLDVILYFLTDIYDEVVGGELLNMIEERYVRVESEGLSDFKIYLNQKVVDEYNKNN